MSKLGGHYHITLQALKELQEKCAHDPMLSTVRFPNHGRFRNENWMIVDGIRRRNEVPTDPAWGAVLRDIRDVFNGGHWLAFAQKHHFMRASRQSQHEAYEAGVNWIRGEAATATRLIQTQIERYHRRAHPDWRPGMPVARSGESESCPVDAPQGEHSRWRLLNLGGYPSIHLGNAFHALQDSFSTSHVTRDALGRIEYIFRYSGEEKLGHSEADHAWKISDTEFSESGSQAVRATKDLMILVLEIAYDLQATVGSNLQGWDRFQRRWLAKSPALGTTTGDAAPISVELPIHGGRVVHVAGGVPERATLSGIAKAEYGSFDLWPLIYDLNKEEIGSNPNRLRHGQRLLILPIERYSPQEIAEAKRRAPTWKNYR